MSLIERNLAELAPIGPLTEWLDAHVPELGIGPLKTELLCGGTSNVVLTIERGERKMVLRRPPTVPPPGAKKGVLREARILTALNPTNVPHPHCYGSCADPEVIGAPFYVMELVDRWAGQLASYKDRYGYASRTLKGCAETEAWLRSNVLKSEVTGIIHGDVGTLNMMFQHALPAKLAAMVDWELSTISDPMLDLGWFTGSMCDEDDPARTFPTVLQDPALFPTKQELARYYCAGTGRDTADFAYFSILAKFKSGCLLEYKVAQARLGGGRIHHAMRTVGKRNRAIEMMLERAVSRRTRRRMLGDHQMVQAKIADSLIELEQFRLLVLKTAWMIDEIEAGRLPHGAARDHFGMCKVAMASAWMNVIGRALEVHGSLGISLDLPLAGWFGGGMGLAIADGPTDVHKSQLARARLKRAKPVNSMFPSEHIPTRTAEALRRYPQARS